MKRIEAEGMKYIYFAKAEGLPDKVFEEASVNKDELEMTWNEILAAHLEDIRLVLIESPMALNQKYAYFLQWNNRMDLDDLDVRVQNNTYSDQDFANAVVTNLIRLRCVKNDDWQGYRLVLRTSDAYLHNPKLEDIKIQSRQASGEPLTCPICSANLHQFVVKIF